MTVKKEGQSRSGVRKKLKATPLPPDDPLWQNEFVIGQSRPRARPSNPRQPHRGRGLPHQYPWIDSVDDMKPSKSSEEDSDG